jgi:hypothetical protein
MHKCECKCEHKNLVYCDCCGKVTCADCGHQWEEKCEMQHYTWYPSTITQPYTPPYWANYNNTTTTSDCNCSCHTS